MNKQIIQKRIKDLYLEDILDRKSPAEVSDYFLGLQQLYIEQGFISLTLKYETDYDGCDLLTLLGTRVETDEEYNYRIIREESEKQSKAEKALQMEKNELALYLRLKAKYETV